MAEEVSGGDDLAGVVGDVEGEILDGVAPGPIGAGGEWVVEGGLFGEDGLFAVFVDALDFLVELGAGEVEGERGFDGVGVVVGFGAVEGAFEGGGEPADVSVGDVGGEFSDAEEGGVGAHPEVRLVEIAEGFSEFPDGEIHAGPGFGVRHGSGFT